MKKLILAALLFSAAALASCEKTEGKEEPDIPPVEADISLTMDRTTKVLYYGDRKTAGVYNYFLGLGDAEFIKDEQGDDAAPEGGHIVFFDIYADKGTDSFETAELPVGKYTLADTDAAGTLNNYYTRMQIWDNGDQKSVDFVEGSLSVSNCAKGKLLEATFTLADGKILTLVYEGALVFGNPDEGAGEEDIPTLKNPVDATFIEAVGVYLGDEYGSGVDTFMVGFSDVPLDSEGMMIAAGYNVVLTMFADHNDSFIWLPDGTYTVADTYKAGTIEPGEIFLDIYGSYCAKVGADSEAEELGLITGGTVTVSEAGTGYKFVLNLTTAEGVSVKGSFVGEIDFADQSPKHESSTTLTGDYTLDLSKADEISVGYYGDYYENGLANWVLDIADSTGDGIEIELITEATSKTEIPLPEKQYNMSVDYGVGFVAGEDNEAFGMLGTWYIDLSTKDSDGYVYGYAAAIEGNVKLSKAGDITTVEFAFVDENWNLFNGTWSGKLPTATDESDFGGLSAYSTAHKIQKHAAKIGKSNCRATAAAAPAKHAATKKAFAMPSQKR